MSGGILGFLGKLFDSGPFKIFRWFASAAVGIPVAVMGTVVLGSALAVTQIIEISQAKLFEKGRGEFETKVNDAVWKERKETLAKGIGWLWSGMAAHPYTVIAKKIEKGIDNWEDEAGFGKTNPGKYHPDNVLAFKKEPDAHDKIRREIQRDLSKEDRKTLLPKPEEIEKRADTTISDPGNAPIPMGSRRLGSATRSGGRGSGGNNPAAGA